MIVTKKFMLAWMCLQLPVAAQAAGPAPAKPARAKSASAPAPLPEAERYAKKCQGQAPSRTSNPQGTMLWGIKRDWDTEKVAEESRSVLVSASLQPMWPTGTAAPLQLQGGHLVAQPAGAAVVGMVVPGVDSEGKPVEVAICGAEASPGDPDTVSYSIEAWNAKAQEWENPCVALDRTSTPRAFAVGGVWDATGARKDVPGRFTFACENGAIAKCIGWGYKPWGSRGGKSLTELHQACTRMARADYCGDGRSFTHMGTMFDYYDGLGVNARTLQKSAQWDPAAGSLEAAWAPDGATCLAHTRDGRALDEVIKTCPTRFRKGAEVDLGDGDRCSVQRTDVSPKAALLRNRSYGIRPGAPLPTASKP